jgi:PleD family two-component response regulator
MREKNNKQLLIVDDNVNYISNVKSHFEEKGYIVDYAINGSQAIRMLPENSYQLIVIEYDTPILNGLEFLEILSKSNYSKTRNIVMLTGIKDNLIKQKAINLGVREVIDRNMIMDSVFDKISLYLS